MIAKGCGDIPIEVPDAAYPVQFHGAVVGTAKSERAAKSIAVRKLDHCRLLKAREEWHANLATRLDGSVAWFVGLNLK